MYSGQNGGCRARPGLVLRVEPARHAAGLEVLQQLVQELVREDVSRDRDAIEVLRVALPGEASFLDGEHVAFGPLLRRIAAPVFEVLLRDDADLDLDKAGVRSSVEERDEALQVIVVALEVPARGISEVHDVAVAITLQRGEEQLLPRPDLSGQHLVDLDVGEVAFAVRVLVVLVGAQEKPEQG
jgi:hypothetical protein